ncbi:MAG: glycoside hydrolase family 97 catalytic domain-containing protein [Dysgonamonadaceae bacterium]|jgi:alpha-glucosidase|nr:glycoside hydrolase family 97 catalytic domain-containing protein [Dysgonamonadaceae bacterium]
MKNMYIKNVLFLAAALFVSLNILGNTPVKTIYSPDNQVKIEVFLQNDSLFYKAFYNNALVVDVSNIGIRFTGGHFLQNLVFDSKRDSLVNETYALPSGKTDVYHNNCNEVTARFKTATATLEVVFRAYNEGFAFRYQSPDASALNVVVQQENSFVNVANFESSWVQKYHPDYSWYYEKRDWNLNVNTGHDQRGLNTPALVKSGDAYLLISEAANYGTYAASRLIANQKEGSYNFEPVGNINTPVPFATPWRVVFTGNLKTIIESTLIENLNPPSLYSDFSWIRPGRVAWDWGGEDARNTVGFAISKSYIDLAARMGWEYYNLDDGWDSNLADYQLSDIVNYADSKGVKLIVWTHNNRFANDRQDMYNKLSAWKNLGVAGIKVDFWENDNQATMQKYEKLLDVTAELQLLVNFHGCTKPSGLRRRFPHFLASEAVLGGEFYFGDMPQMVHSKHNISVALTRNVIGSMDFTPCDFAKKNGMVQHETSWAQQLAHTVLYESGLLYFLDHPNNYRYHLAESFLKRIPAAWSEIKCLEAEPDKYVTIARKKDGDWFVASITDAKRTLNLNLSFLDENKIYNAYIYKDGDCKSEIAFDFQTNLTNTGSLSIPLLASGGVTIQFSENAGLPKPAQQKWEAENGFTYGSKITDGDGLCSGGKYVANIGKMNKLRFDNINVEKDTLYALTIFYMSDEEKSAYIKINNEAEPLYYDFMNTGGERGRRLAMKTVVVALKAGDNTFEFGNTQAFAPCIDRITIKPLVDEAGATNTIPPVGLQNQFSWYVKENTAVLNSDCAGNFTLFDLQGNKYSAGKIIAGENRIVFPRKGVFIISVNAGYESVSFKTVNK